MEFTRLSVLALFCLTLVGEIDASQFGEDYWQTVWPNTPLPKPLSDLLMPYSRNNVPSKDEEDKQYWTVFFKHDLYPGKKMILGFHKHNDIPTFRSRVRSPMKKESQPFGINTWWDPKASQASKTKGWLGKTIAKKRHGLNDFCGNHAAIGEDKYCASSLQSMMKFVVSKLGTNIKVIRSSFAQNQDQYVVEEVWKIGDKAVMCHRLNFKKVVFYCHQVDATTTYMVSLVASDGTKAKAITICHHDTRGMNPNVLYEVLKVKPGTVPVCHFVGNKAITWVPIIMLSEFDDHPCLI